VQQQLGRLGRRRELVRRVVVGGIQLGLEQQRRRQRRA
jgi:hypothetical protein